MPHSSLSAALRAPAKRWARLWWPGLWRWAWRIALGLLSAAWVLAIAGWLTLQWLILPRLDDWRPRLEMLATRALGHPVEIGHLAAEGGGWLPMFRLRDVVLRDPTGAEALRLPQVQAALSAPSLLALRLRFDQLLIEGARLDVRRDRSGRLFVGGLAVGPQGGTLPGDDAASADWLFSQHALLVRGGTLRWLDEQRGAPALALHDVQLLLRNSGRRHSLRLDATPPPDWGDRFTLQGTARGALLSRAGDWRRWQGTLHAQLPRADVARLRHHVTLPVDLQQGRAALRAWLAFDAGAPQALTLDAVLRDVSLGLGRTLEPVALADASARLVAERQGGGGLRLALQKLQFTLPDGQHWAPSDMLLQWKAAPAAAAAPASAGPVAPAAPAEPAGSGGRWLPPLDGGQFSADRLDLPLLATLAERLPIGAGVRALLRQLEPEGTVSALEARWDGPLDAPRSWSAKAGVQGLAIRAAASPEAGGIGRPGWRGADLRINANQAGGTADLVLADGQITLPGVFAEPVVGLRHFSTQLAWTVTPAEDGTAPAIALKVQNASFDNADASGTLNASWRTGSGAGVGKGARLPGVLSLQGALSEGRAAQVARYLPLGIGDASRLWTERAVRSGELREVEFRVQGDLWDFPFVNRRDGDFRIAAKLVDVALAPVPSVPAGGREPAWESPWPSFTNIHGELLFERDAMQFNRTRGRLWGLALEEVSGSIRSLSADTPQLQVDGFARGPLADMLRVLRTPALADATGHLLDAASASGPAELKLGLTVPLGHSQDTQLKAGLLLQGNELRLRPDLPLLANARGRLEASHKGVSWTGLRAQLLGGEAQLDGASQADGSLRLTVNGQATADALRRASELGPGVARLAQRLQGQAGYRLQTSVRNGLADWQLASNLQGLAIDLPAPLGKPADLALALRASSQAEPRPAAAAPGGAAAGSRDLLRLELGPLKGSMLVESSPGGSRPLRSAWAWDAPLPEAVPGGRAVLALARLDADRWQALLAQPPAAAAPAGAGSTAAASAAADDSAWLPQAVQLTTPELQIGGRRLNGVALNLQRLAASADSGEGWRAQLRADQAAGTLDYRSARQAGAPGRLQARLTRLHLGDNGNGASAPAATGPERSAERSAGSLPAVELEVADFTLQGRQLGSLALQAQNRPLPADATGRPAAPEAAGRSEWQVTALRLHNPDATLTATGRWDTAPGPARARMLLAFTLEVANGGALLERLGFGKVLRGAAGRLEGTLGWDGSPLALDMPSLAGQLTLDIQRGQFLQMEPGAARLLGVMSLQALPRRLALDFRDVFQQGFAFETATARVAIAQGVASTENLRLRGLQALVAMAGSADIARETQDLHVVVVPELNSAASASLAYAAINPAVGLGALVGQWLLREPLRLASAREFRVTGQWDAPRVDRLERGLLDPLPASASARGEPASAAPAPRPAPPAAAAASAASRAASAAP